MIKELDNEDCLAVAKLAAAIIDGYPPENLPFWPAFKLWDAGRRSG